MMSTIRPIDQARAARLMLATLDDDLDRLNLVLEEANNDQAVNRLLAVLLLDLIAVTTDRVGEDRVRAIAEQSIVAAGEAGR